MGLLELVGLPLRRVGGKHGGEFAGACPFCGDGGKGRGSDRFHIWPGQGRTGRYWCRVCGREGDAIQYLRDRDGLSFREACERLGVAAEALPIKPVKISDEFVPAAASPPPARWQEHAGKFLDYCHQQLLDNKFQMRWLAGRGIFMPQVEYYRLGWNPSPAWRERPAWGLPVELKDNGVPKKLWLPAGLVIPLLDNGVVQRLRIRQPEGDPRYYVIPGSSRGPLVSRSSQGMVIVESELDAILLDGCAGDLAGFAAMGNAVAKPTADLHDVLVRAIHISVSLDTDQPRHNRVTGRMEIPGAQASRWWTKTYRQAERVPIIGGKDPGDAYRAGVDLRSWVLAGMPPYFQVAASMPISGLT